MKNYEILTKLKNSKSICIIGHIDPDADALSSMVVLKEFIYNNFQIETVDLFADCKKTNAMYDEILGEVEINTQTDYYDTAIIVDTPNLERIGKYKYLFDSAKLKIMIDHHATNNHSGDFNIVEMCSSTCEIIYSILKYFKYNISKEIKGKIYAGIITDTNNFTVGNFKKRTFKIASECIDDINNEEIYNHFLANNSRELMDILAISIHNLKSYENGRILISHITQEDLTNINASVEDCSGIINKLATISESKFVCFIYPKGENYYVSMRTKNGGDVSLIAKQNGGGGHKGAAAFLSFQPIEDIEDYISLEFTSQLEKIETTNTSIF